MTPLNQVITFLPAISFTMDINLLISFIGASLLLAVMPGPDNIFVLTESLTKGTKHGLAVSLGLASGVLIHTLAAATGVSIIIQQSAIAFSVIKYIGAAYLLYLAYKAIKEKRPIFSPGKVESNDFQFGKLYRKGFLMNVLNPKVALFFVAFFPQFVSQTGFNPIWQMLILGGLFIVCTILIFGGVALLSGRLSKFMNSDKFWKYTKWSKVTVLSLLGITLALAKK